MAPAEASKAPPPRDSKHPLPHEKDGFAVSAIGKQSQSQRESIPATRISSVARAAYDNVYISEGHTRTAKIGRESPPGGPIYKTRGTLGGVSFGFGTAVRDITTLKRTSTNEQRPGEFFTPSAEHPGDMPTNDALGACPDTQVVKYCKEPSAIMGTDPKGKLKDAFLLQSHSVAFFARDSPGPAGCGGEFGPAWKGTKKELAPARKFGARTYTKGQDWLSFGDNPPDVGPGRHERKDVSLGQQHLTKRRNQPVNRFGAAPKFLKTPSQPAISVLDSAKSSLGRQTLARNKSEPVVNFSADNRATRAKSMLCMTRQDMGPSANMPKFTAPQPSLPMERHVMRSGFG